MSPLDAAKLRPEEEAVRRHVATIADLTHSPAFALVLERALECAVIAAEALCFDVDPDDAGQVRKLQNEVRRFADMAAWIKGVIDADALAQVAGDATETTTE